MTISRRTFIVGSGLAASAPFIGNALSRSANAAPLPQAAIPRTFIAVGTAASEFALRIDGWELANDTSPSSGASAVWISLGRSWRSTWR